MGWKGKGIIYGSASPHRIFFLTLSKPYPPPSYHIRDTYNVTLFPVARWLLCLLCTHKCAKPPPEV